VGSSSRAKRPTPSTNALLPERTVGPTCRARRPLWYWLVCRSFRFASPSPLRSTPSPCPRFPHRSGRGRLLSNAACSAIGLSPSCPWRCFSGP